MGATVVGILINSTGLSCCWVAPPPPLRDIVDIAWSHLLSFPPFFFYGHLFRVDSVLGALFPYRHTFFDDVVLRPQGGAIDLLRAPRALDSNFYCPPGSTPLAMSRLSPSITSDRRNSSAACPRSPEWGPPTHHRVGSLTPPPSTTVTGGKHLRFHSHYW